MISAELFGVALPDSLKKIASFCLVETCHCEAVIESVLTGPKQLFLQSNKVLTGIGLCAVKFRKLYSAIPRGANREIHMVHGTSSD